MSTVTLHPIGPTAYDHLMSEMIDSRRRAVRMETRLCKLMEHFGLDETGRPVPQPPPGYTAEELERDNPYNQWMRVES